MVPNKLFLKQPKSFWSQVKLISMSLGYSKGEGLKTYTIEEIQDCFKEHNLTTKHLVDSSGSLTEEAKLLLEYFKYRLMFSKKLLNQIL